MLFFLKRFFMVFAVFFLLLPAQAYPRLQVDPPSSLTARNFFVMDAHSGAVLAEKDPDERVEPASLVKIMTAYLVFRELKAGKISLDEEVLVSERAWRTGMTGASRMYIEVGTMVTIEDLIRGMIVQSGNDACVALAERIAGTEQAFVDLMNAQARALGMQNTRFQNSHGLPSQEEQYTSARDIVTLAAELIRNFPEYYGYYSERSFTYNDITQHNRNLLLGRDSSVDGVKTGWTRAAGYNLVSSALRDGMRLVSVVMGIQASSGRQGASARATQTLALLNWGFRQFETVPVIDAGRSLAEPRVWKGAKRNVAAGIKDDLYVTIPRGSGNNLRVDLSLEDSIQAPVAAGSHVGRLSVSLGEELIVTRTLLALETVDRGRFFRVLWDSVRGLFPTKK